MAPEEGLEPSTHRLTADCSTIELLWNTEMSRDGRRSFRATSTRTSGFQARCAGHLGVGSVFVCLGNSRTGLQGCAVRCGT